VVTPPGATLRFSVNLVGRLRCADVELCALTPEVAARLRQEPGLAALGARVHAQWSDLATHVIHEGATAEVAGATADTGPAHILALARERGTPLLPLDRLLALLREGDGRPFLPPHVLAELPPGCEFSTPARHEYTPERKNLDELFEETLWLEDPAADMGAVEDGEWAQGAAAAAAAAGEDVGSAEVAMGTLSDPPSGLAAAAGAAAAGVAAGAMGREQPSRTAGKRPWLGEESESPSGDEDDDEEPPERQRRTLGRGKKAKLAAAVEAPLSLPVSAKDPSAAPVPASRYASAVVPEKENLRQPGEGTHAPLATAAAVAAAGVPQQRPPAATAAVPAPPSKTPPGGGWVRKPSPRAVDDAFNILLVAQMQRGGGTGAQGEGSGWAGGGAGEFQAVTGFVVQGAGGGGGRPALSLGSSCVPAPAAPHSNGNNNFKTFRKQPVPGLAWGGAHTGAAPGPAHVPLVMGLHVEAAPARGPAAPTRPAPAVAAAGPIIKTSEEDEDDLMFDQAHVKQFPKPAPRPPAGAAGGRGRGAGRGGGPTAPPRVVAMSRSQQRPGAGAGK
jgi:hypothetical protein